MMHTLRRNLYFVLLIAASAAAQPTITGLSVSTAARSGRLLIQGSGFGSMQVGGHVDIGGIVAPLTRWSDTLLATYVPERASIGTVNVQVFDSTGSASNAVPLNVTSRSGQSGRIRWRFQVDADYILSRPALASDGSVYSIDVYGHLYALAPDGGLKWIFNASHTGFGNVSLGADGAIYTGSTDAIFALAPDGTLKWQFNQNPGAFILLGPNVGPDGNIYAVGTQGMGVFSLTPQGTLRWATPENYDRPIVILQEIVFSPPSQSRLYFHANRHLRGIGLDGTPLFTYVDGLPQDNHQPAVAPDGSLYTNLYSAFGPGLMMGKFDDNGNLLWQVFDKFSNSTNALSAPDVGPDGIIYNGRNLNTLYAINPDSSMRWQYTDPEPLMLPIVSPLNDLIFVSGATNGQPGFFEAVSTTGSLLWKIPLPVESGFNVDPDPFARARFTPDGQTAYIGTSIAGQPSNGYSYLYSIQTGNGGTVSLASLALNPTTVKGGVPSQGIVTLSGPAPASGAVVTLASNRKAAAKVPASITVPAGATSATFTINTKVVLLKKIATISASYAGVTKTAKLVLMP
jgi:outer membrane protein assembly factor BamB